MKLKLVVASMSILGLISAPAFADETTSTQHHKVKVRHHHHVRHHRVMPVHHDYKDMGELPVKDAPVEAACVVSPTTILMNEMTQSVGRSMASDCNPGWFNRIAMSGGINLDVGKFGNRSADLQGVNYQRLSLNDVYVNITGTVNDWTKAFASISYSDPSDSYSDVYSTSNTFTFGSTNNGSSFFSTTTGNAISLEQAYVTFANFDVTPVFVQLGKGFQDFSRYEIHPITRSTTQVLSETLATAAKIGFIVPMGLTGSISVFDNKIVEMSSSKTPTNFVAALGYDMKNEQLGFDVGGAYIHNMTGVNDVAAAVRFWELTNGNTGYASRKAGYAVYADVNSGPFTIGARFTAAASRFNVMDAPRNTDFTQGAKPWAVGVQANYEFVALDRTNNLYLGYQASREAGFINLPKSRWVLGYNIDAWKSANLGIEWDHDKAYGASSFGAGRNFDLVSLRAAVKFG